MKKEEDLWEGRNGFTMRVTQCIITLIKPHNAGDSDFFEITNYLLPLMDEADVYNLGRVLGLYPDRLKAIQCRSLNFLDDVVLAWLRREGDVDKRGGPRWSTLVVALRNQRLRQTKIAYDISRDKGI